MKLKSEPTIKYKRIIYVSRYASNEVLKNIIDGKRISYNKLEIFNLKKKIELLRDLYLQYSKNSNNKKDMPRNYIFWRILKDHYKIIDFKIKKKNKANISFKSKCKSNLIYSTFTKTLGYNPTLLELCINAILLKKITRPKVSFPSINLSKSFCNLENNEAKVFYDVLSKKKIQLISPICPDYDYIKLGKNLYSFTFSALNTNIGLSGHRLVNEIGAFYDYLKKNGITYSHEVYYGDFEAYSNLNCKRLNLNQQSFIDRLNLSINKLEEKKMFDKIGLFVNDLSDIKEWESLMRKNRKIIKKKLTFDDSFLKNIDDILSARLKLYQNWYPKRSKSFYKSVLLEQGSEYATMTDIIKNKFTNPLIIAADHPKMRFFYNLNENIALAYLQKAY